MNMKMVRDDSGKDLFFEGTVEDLRASEDPVLVNFIEGRSDESD